MEKSARHSIVVVGSINTDMVVRSDKLPRPGETVLGGVFYMNQGGKGANQAVAASRLGAEVRMVAKVGGDAFGAQSKASLQADGVDTSSVLTDTEHASGVAAILVDKGGENMISVASGTNLLLTPAEVDAAESAFEGADIVLMQLEVPVVTVAEAARIGRRHGAHVILNPAPAPQGPLPTELLANVDMLIPNQTEAELISGVPVTDFESAARAARTIGGMGVRTVMITMGSQGVFVYDATDGSTSVVHANRVQAVDATAAGDCFCGALSVALAEGCALDDAVRFANRAAALSVTRRGAQPSLPYRRELDLKP